MSEKLFESLKSPDFDVEFFVQATTGSQRTLLATCSRQIEVELREAVKEANLAVINTAQNCQDTTGELLGLREQLGPLRQTLDRACIDAQTKLHVLKTKQAQLAQCIEASRIVRKLAKLQTDAAKLRALFPNDAAISTSSHADLINKVSMVMGSIDIHDYNELDGINIGKTDLLLIRKIYSAIGNTKR